MSFGPNPFESPQAELGELVPDDVAGGNRSDDERIRRELLKHEVSIQAVGRLMMLGGVLLTVGGVTSLAATFTSDTGLVYLAAFYFVVGIPSVWIGNLLRRLDRRGRIPAAAIHAVGLLGIPIGTLISAYILYLLLSVKGQRVLSAEYQGIVARTPHIRYKSPLLLVLLLAIVIAVCVAAIVGAVT